MLAALLKDSVCLWPRFTQKDIVYNNVYACYRQKQIEDGPSKIRFPGFISSDFNERAKNLPITCTFCFSAYRNGTCYTSSECTSKGGTASGNCASGWSLLLNFYQNFALNRELVSRELKLLCNLSRFQFIYYKVNWHH